MTKKKQTKTLQKNFHIDVYDIFYTVKIFPSTEDLDNYYDDVIQKIDNDKRPLPVSRNAFFIAYQEQVDDGYVPKIELLFSAEHNKSWMITHEAVHLATYILAMCGIKFGENIMENDEILAYLLGLIVKQITQFIEEK